MPSSWHCSYPAAKLIHTPGLPYHKSWLSREGSSTCRCSDVSELSCLWCLNSWGDIVTKLRTPPLSLLRAKFFGRKTLGELAGSLATPSYARSLEDLREETAVALTALLDFSFSNRVIYFNQMDKAAVEALTAASADTVDLEEPRSYLKEAKLLLKKVAVYVI